MSERRAMLLVCATVAELVLAPCGSSSSKARGTVLCTDDRKSDDLLRDGHINDVVRKPIRLGCDPVGFGQRRGALASTHAHDAHNLEEVAADATGLGAAARGDLGATRPTPFMAMSFPALSVLSERCIADRGLVDAVRFEPVPLGLEKNL
ncbi:MAG: adenine deaminase C-terminal domain-containing protein [Micromonosporaceae bacterium]